MLNKYNYEIYFLDYHEGKLPAEVVAELFLFLDKNPELREEFEGFENISLNDFSNEIFSGKENLKQPVITFQNINDFLIAELEGDLSIDERKSLEEFLQLNPQYKTDREIFSKTVLSAESVSYLAKSSLKKEEVVFDGLTLNQLLIAETEGDINTSQQNFLSEFVSTHPEVEKDRKLFAATKLQPDEIIYPNKGELKKTVMLWASTQMRYAMSIAAAIIIMVGFYFVNQKSHSTISVADSNNISKSTNQDSIKPGSSNPDSKNQKEVLPENKLKEKPKPSNFNQYKLPAPSKSYFAQQKIVNDTAGENQIPVKFNTPPNVPQQNNLAHDDKQNQNPEKLNQPNPVQPVNSNPLANNENTVDDNSIELSVKQALGNLANKKIADITGNDEIAQQEIPRQKKMLDALAWTLGKVSGKKVQMKNQYTTSNDLMNTEITAGNFSVELPGK